MVLEASIWRDIVTLHTTTDICSTERRATTSACGSAEGTNDLHGLSVEDLQKLEHHIIRAKNAKVISLLDLPAELRKLIWHFALIAELKLASGTGRGGRQGLSVESRDTSLP